MATSEDSSRNVAAPRPVAGAVAANPAALTVAQLARLLGVAEQKVREHVTDGAPVSADGMINLVHYTAWLLKKTGDRRLEAGESEP